MRLFKAVDENGDRSLSIEGKQPINTSKYLINTSNQPINTSDDRLSIKELREQLYGDKQGNKQGSKQGSKQGNKQGEKLGGRGGSGAAKSILNVANSVAQLSVDIDDNEEEEEEEEDYEETEEEEGDEEEEEEDEGGGGDEIGVCCISYLPVIKCLIKITLITPMYTRPLYIYIHHT